MIWGQISGATSLPFMSHPCRLCAAPFDLIAIHLVAVRLSYCAKPAVVVPSGKEPLGASPPQWRRRRRRSEDHWLSTTGCLCAAASFIPISVRHACPAANLSPSPPSRPLFITPCIRAAPHLLSTPSHTAPPPFPPFLGARRSRALNVTPDASLRTPSTPTVHRLMPSTHSPGLHFRHGPIF